LEIAANLYAKNKNKNKNKNIILKVSFVCDIILMMLTLSLRFLTNIYLFGTCEFTLILTLNIINSNVNLIIIGYSF
jgi:hypothetical protein